MRAAPISASISGANCASKNATQNNQSKMRVNSNYSSFSPQKSYNPSFGWFLLDDLFYYGNRKLNDSREAARKEQREGVNKKVLDDVTLLAKKLRIPRDVAQEKYNEYLKIGGIEPKKNGCEVGLNRVIGYCGEKLDLIKDVVAPIVEKQNCRQKNREFPSEMKLPNGVIFYGPSGRGKSYMMECLQEHFKEKNGERCINTDLVKLDSPWKNGDTEENLNAIERVFDKAMEDGIRYGRHTIVFINGLDKLLDEENNPGLCAKFLMYAIDCSDSDTTWVGTINSPQDHPEWLFSPSITSKEIGVKNMSDVETSALMSYFWAQKDRKDDSDHSKVLDFMNEKGVQLYPPQFKKLAETVDKKLKDTEDYSSFKRGTYKKPVRTQDVIAGIQEHVEKVGGQDSDKIPSGLTDEQYLAIVKEKYNANK